MPARKKTKKKTAKKTAKKKAQKKVAKKKIAKKKVAKIKEDGLSPKQLCFCNEYLVDFNATQAAIRAGYSKKTAKEQGYKQFTKVHIREKLQELIQKQTVRTQIDADKVIKEISRVALADVRLAFNKDGTLKAIHDIPEDLGRAISGIEVEETYEGTGKDRVWTGYVKKIKFWSKDKQLEVLMRHLGLFKEDNKQVGQTLASAVHEALKEK